MAGPVLPKSSIDLGNLLGFPPPLKSYRKFKDLLPVDCRDMHCPPEPAGPAATEVWCGEGRWEVPQHGAGTPGMSRCWRWSRPGMSPAPGCPQAQAGSGGRRMVAASLIPELSGGGSSSTELFGARCVWTYRAWRSEVSAKCCCITKKGAMVFLSQDLQSPHWAQHVPRVQGSSRAL